MRIVFLSPDVPPAGGRVAARVRSVAGRDDLDVAVVLTDARPPGAADVTWEGVPVLDAGDARAHGADVAIAVDWRAAAHVFSVHAARPVLLLDDFAYERMAPGDTDRLPAAIAVDLPVDVLAGGAWIVEALAARRPGVRARIARAAVDPALFHAPDDRAADGLLRVLVDDRWAGEAAAGHRTVAELTTPHQVIDLPTEVAAAERAALLRAADVLLLLDPAAGDGAIVREALACGVVPVALPTGGQGEAIADEVTGLLVEPDDDRGTARRLDRLAVDDERLEQLRAAALQAAAGARDEAAAGTELRAALAELRDGPLPDAAQWPARLMADAIAQAAVVANEHQAVLSLLHGIERGDAYRAGTRLMDTWQSPRLAGVRRLARPVSQRVKPRLNGGPDA